MSNLEKQIVAYRNAAEKYAEDNLKATLKGEILTEEEHRYIIEITSSMLLMRDGITDTSHELEFIQALLEDKLAVALSKGSHLLIKCMKFFVMAKEWCAVSY